MKTIRLKIEGYYSKEQIDDMPVYNGLYLVYTAAPVSDKEVILKKLIYIGKTEEEEGISGRLSYHEKMEDFEEEANVNEIIVFNCAPVEKDNIKRVEDALIYSQQPVLNDKSTKSFNFLDTELIVSGKCGLIKSGIFKTNRGTISIIRESCHS